MWYEFLAIGSFSFILFLALFFLVLLLFTVAENIYGLALTIISAMVFLQLFSDFHPWSSIASWYFPLWIILYLVVGAGWSIWKWYRFCNAEWNKLDTKDAKKRYEDHKDNYKSYQELLLVIYHLPPTASYNREKIETWIIAWPFSIVIDLLRDPIKLIYDALLTTYDRIAKSAAGGKDI